MVRFAIFLLVGCGLASILSGVWTAVFTGVNWDDLTELQAFRNLLTLQYSPPANYATAVHDVIGTDAFYGNVPQALAHMLAALSGVEPWSGANATPAAFAERHLVVLGLALLATGMLTWTSWRLGACRIFVAAVPATLLMLPLFVGHVSMNIKDGPPASGLTLASCGLALWLRQAKERLRLGPAALIVFGVWLTVGTRAGGVVLVIILVGLTSLVALIAYRSAGAVIALTSAACVTLGVALVVAGNPVGRLAPLRWLLDSVELASRFPGVHPIVMFGHVVDCNHLPLWYVPGWLAVQIPTPYMLLLAAGLAGCVKGWRLVGSKSAASWAPFAIQGAVLPVMIVASGAVMYDGLRHLLFMLPPLAMVAASGVTTLGSLAVTR